MRFALFVLSAAACWACMCVGSSPLPLDAWRSSELVFLGEVTRIDPPPESADLATAARAVHMAVVESFKGTGDRNEFVLQQEFHNCALQFKLGDRAILYLSERSMQAYVCGASRHAEYAEDDLAVLRALPHSAETNRLSGTVHLYADMPSERSQRVRALAGVEVTITGPNGRITTSTNASGLYEQSGLPPGTYDVSIALPQGLGIDFRSVQTGFIPRAGERDLIKLGSSSHVRVIYYLYEDTKISGRVLGPNGAPLHQACVSLEPPGEEVEEPDNISCTDATGQYELKKMLSGPYRIKLAKGIAAEPMSQLVIVQAGTPLTGVDFRIPKLAPRVTLSGRVRHADGRAAKDATVSLGDSASILTNEAGEFRIVAEPSDAASLVADNPDCRDTNSIPLAIAPTKDLANILLTVPPCK